MMKAVFPMWADGKKLLINSVFERFPTLFEFRWTVTEFDGWGFIPDGLTFREFAAKALHSGYELQPKILVQFVAETEEVHFLRMEGRSDDGRTATIEAFDSSEWTVTIDE